MFIISASTKYTFSDVFTNPLDIREAFGDSLYEWVFDLTEVYGTPYPITGSWYSDLEAKVFVDAAQSKYGTA